MTELNIENHKKNHQYLSPSIGTYNPNYNSIYKKTKGVIIKDDTKEKFIKNKSGNNIIQNLSLNSTNNKKLYSTISSRHLYTEEERDKNKNRNVLSYNTNYQNKYPLIFRNKNDLINYNVTTINSFSTNKKKHLKSRIKKMLLKNEFDIKNNNSISSINNKSNSSIKKIVDNNIDIFNKTRTYDNNNENINNKKNNLKNKTENLSYKSIFIKPDMPSIGYYNPKYDIINANIPKISFLYHNNKKDEILFKKNLLRRVITKYHIDTDYQVVKSLNDK